MKLIKLIEKKLIKRDCSILLNRFLINNLDKLITESRMADTD